MFCRTPNNFSTTVKLILVIDYTEYFVFFCFDAEIVNGICIKLLNMRILISHFIL